MLDEERTYPHVEANALDINIDDLFSQTQIQVVRSLTLCADFPCCNKKLTLVLDAVPRRISVG